MTPTGTCTECGRRFTGWALTQDRTCPTCGGEIKTKPVPTGWRPLSGFVQENDPRYEEVEDE